MTIQEAYKRAIDGGWDCPFKEEDPKTILNPPIKYIPKIPNSKTHICNFVFLDPEFWKCLGKSMGWKDQFVKREYVGFEEDEITLCKENGSIPMWQYEWHRFIDYLSQGNSIEDYFKDIK